MPKAFGFEFATDDILESTQAGDCAESESSQVPPREDAVPPQLHLLQDVVGWFVLPKPLAMELD